MLEARALLIEWAHGWSVSRGCQGPVVIDRGVKIDVGAPVVSGRYVLPVGRPRLHRRAARGDHQRELAQGPRV